uniref:EOG090X0FS7 n=1 Tax=Moina brachiata TaxID=675436 RepID=A0A4Y7NJB9_9CRUS|nr:EOG090X0FS7 [Moina brachiata]
MSETDDETNSDHMSVSDQEGDASRGEEIITNLVANESHVELTRMQDSSLSSTPASSDGGEKNEIDITYSEKSPQTVIEESRHPTVELDDAALDLMSGSYSEIFSPSRFKVESVPEEVKPTLQNLAMEGTLMKEGDMVHFIAKNLETKIRLSSPDISECGPSLATQSESLRPESSLALDSSLLALLEREARCIAASVDGLTEHLAVSLHTISAVTAQSLSVYKDSVCKTCDAMDANIKSMYQLMAKCEELGKGMAPIYKLSEQVKEIKKLLDIMENLS